jgi:GxxExxY protein
MLDHHALTERIIGLAIKVHQATGPGLLEPVYSACLCFELEQAGIPVLRQVGIPITYAGLKMPVGFRADILAAGAIIVEVKGVAELTPLHEQQVQTYLRMGGVPVGLLLNFHSLRLTDGLRRFVNSGARVLLNA